MLCFNVKPNYLRVEIPKMFLIFTEHKEFLKMPNFAYGVYFGYNFVAWRNFHKLENVLTYIFFQEI